MEEENSLPVLNSCTIAVIGLGYVGLPLSVELGTRSICYRTGKGLCRKVIGFDINYQRVSELMKKIDRTNEISKEQLMKAISLEITNDKRKLINADAFIVTVPTPVDQSKTPNLNPLIEATKTIGDVIKERKELQECLKVKSNPLIIYESTVFPGATEEIAIPILEEKSGLKINKDFFCGYSPERINPGDKKYSLTSIKKLTSGSTNEAAYWIDNLYGSIIEAGTYMTTNIKTAEAAKVIENTQRDLNIALINELAIIFRKLGIDTQDVLDAASTKWNFLPFRPGLVGGHCIGVDPYYLTYKSQQEGYYPQVVLAGRRINDGMSSWITQQIVLEMAKRGIIISESNILILGMTFKEDCPDIRNTKVIDLIYELEKYKIKTLVCDPIVDRNEALSTYDLRVVNNIPIEKRFEVVIAAVAHKEFKLLLEESWSGLLAENGFFYDIKGIIPRSLMPLRL